MKNTVCAVLLSSTVLAIQVGCASHGTVADFHVEVAHGIEEFYAAELEEHYEDLAHHYSLSDRKAEAVHYLILSGDRAKRAHANDQAAGYYVRATGLADEPVGDEGHEVLANLGEVYLRLTDYDDASRVARQLLASDTDHVRRARAYRVLGVALERGRDMQASIRHFRLGLQELSEFPASREAAWIAAGLFWPTLYSGDADTAIALAESALDVAETRGYDAEASELYACLFWVSSRGAQTVEEFAPALRHAENSLEAARRSGDQSVIGQSTFWVAWIQSRIGAEEAAVARARRAMDMGRRTQSRFVYGQSYGWLSRLLMKRENWTAFKQLTDIFLSE